MSKQEGVKEHVLLARDHYIYTAQWRDRAKG